MTPVIETKNLSKWYGNVLGLSDVSLEIESGITGLLGPNGAGKSTFMKLITGQMKPNIGTVTIRGERVWNDYRLFSRVGFCPEPDAFYEDVTGWEFLTGLLRFYGFTPGRGGRPCDPGPGHCRTLRGQGPQGPELQPRHAPEGEIRPGHRPRSRTS